MFAFARGRRRLAAGAFVLSLVAVFIVACGDDDPTPVPTRAPTAQPTATATTAPQPTEPAAQPTAMATTAPQPTEPAAMMMVMEENKSDSVVIALDEQNDSGQSGKATLTARGDQTEVALVITPGTLESELVHIHIGPCGNDTLGAVVFPLTSFANGDSVTMVDASLASLRTGGFAINSHKKGEPAVYTTCGNIPGGDAMMMSGGATVMSDIQNFRLENLSIKVGTTVVWTQQDSTTHTATSGTPPNGDGTWDTGFLMEGESGDGIVFDKVGTFAYFCRVHNSMTGTVTVTE